MSTISSFRSIKKKQDIYIGKDCLIKFYEFLREYAMKIFNSKTKNNEIMNKRAAGIISKCKNLLCL